MGYSSAHTQKFKYKDLHNEQNPPEILVQQVLDLWAVVFSGKPS